MRPCVSDPEHLRSGDGLNAFTDRMMTINGERPCRIVFLDRGTLSPDIKLAAFELPHELVVFDRTSPSETPLRIRDADIVITNKVKITREAVASTQRLRLVAVAATCPCRKPNATGEEQRIG